MQFFLQYVRLMFDVVSREAQVQHLNMGYHTILRSLCFLSVFP